MCVFGRNRDWRRFGWLSNWRPPRTWTASGRASSGRQLWTPDFSGFLDLRTPPSRTTYSRCSTNISCPASNEQQSVLLSRFFTSPAIEVRSIAMNESVCLSACISQQWRVQAKFSVHVTCGQVKINVTTVNNRCYPPCWRSLASSSFSAQVHKSL